MMTTTIYICISGGEVKRGRRDCFGNLTIRPHFPEHMSTASGKLNIPSKSRLHTFWAQDVARTGHAGISAARQMGKGGAPKALDSEHTPLQSEDSA